MTTAEKLKVILVKDLNLEDLTPGDIDENAPLFGEGLGLDSLDAVELVVIVQKHFGIDIQNMDEAKAAFQSIRSLASYIEGRLSGG
jgi:acyl carrier protein